MAESNEGAKTVNQMARRGTARRVYHRQTATWQTLRVVRPSSAKR